MIPRSFSPQLRPGLLNLWHAACTPVPIILFLSLASIYNVNNMCINTDMCVQTEHELLVLENNTKLNVLTQIGSDTNC
jgi:hypothetical protein